MIELFLITTLLFSGTVVVMKKVVGSEEVEQSINKTSDSNQ